MSEEQRPPQVPPVQTDFSKPPEYVKPPAATNGLIPISNPKALLAYYLAIFSIIPVFCLFLGPAALILGFLGLKAMNEKPEIGGKAHAWVGIILGGLSTLSAIVLIVMILLNLK
jgi:hypothetical protein